MSVVIALTILMVAIIGAVELAMSVFRAIRRP
jgi:hypothetical protein